MIPRGALVRIQLLREAPPTAPVPPVNSLQEPQGVKDLETRNDALAKLFVGVKGFDIYVPTLHAIHECSRNLVFVTLAIPEGAQWSDEGIETLHKMELLAHRGFLTALQTFQKQATLHQEVADYFGSMMRDYKAFCATFITDIEGFLSGTTPDDGISFAPAIMVQERFHLLGLMLKTLCVLTEENGAITI